jgi:hypothetical protein
MTEHKLPDCFSNEKLREYKSDIRHYYETDSSIVGAVENHELYGEFERIHEEIVGHLLSLHKVSICISEAVDDCVDYVEEQSISSSDHSYAWRIRRMGRYYLSLAENMASTRL